MAVKSIEASLIALKYPERIKNDFLDALKKALEARSLELGVPKNFSGNGYGFQALKVVGEKVIDFDLMANGLPQFPQGEHFLLCRLRMFEAVIADLATGNADWVAGVSDAFLKNAKVDIIINGTREWKDIPMLDFTRSEEQNDSAYVDFLDPKFWFAQTDLTIRIKSEVPITTVNLAVGFSLEGPKLIS